MKVLFVFSQYLDVAYIQLVRIEGPTGTRCFYRKLVSAMLFSLLAEEAAHA